ncbi:MAG: EFR1 family ferrodoxin [Desulfocapsaceae bacterium]|nr:EFR1 family ferrodoxin [Desulfocapsaceae bacterium]
MEIKKITTVFFSPTGTSKEVAFAIADNLQMNGTIVECDLTYQTASSSIALEKDDLAVIGVPVYAGRVPQLARERLRALRGDQTPAVIVVVYGNREFEDALIELRDIVVSQSFRVVAGCSFIGEHSYSSAAMPIAQGRPDAKDLALAVDFSARIGEKLRGIESARKVISPDLPGNIPYREGMGNIPVTPEIDRESCTLCELCISTCPADAIWLDGQIEMNAERCIFCCACVKNCPEHAVVITAEPVKEVQKWLYEKFQARKDPELFI